MGSKDNRSRNHQTCYDYILSSNGDTRKQIVLKLRKEQQVTSIIDFTAMPSLVYENNNSCISNRKFMRKPHKRSRDLNHSQ